LTEKTKKRKDDHIKISLSQDIQAKNTSTGFEDIHFIHNALPEINKQEINLSTTFFGHKFSAPLIVSAITGGTEKAEKINVTIAKAVEDLQLGMGVGSQRVAIEDKKLERTFNLVRKTAPNAFLIANIGGVQLVKGYSLKEIEKIIEMIEADAIAIHLNPLQEAVQPEGETSFKGILEKIYEITEVLDKPVIVKETGAGISSEEAKKLESVGVDCIDVSGAGGTNFAAVEKHRKKELQKHLQYNLCDAFLSWGLPTAVSVVEVLQTVNIPVIASGGLRNGVDIAKALALGVNLTGLSHPILKAAIKGVEETKFLLTSLIEQLKTNMFLVGVDSLEVLREVPLVIVNKTAEWLRIRGFNVEKYQHKRG
jgi:isopentenyl-diphosphate delta-isomerase